MAGNEQKKTGSVHSLKHQILAVFVVAMVLALVLITAMNGLFLEKYYTSKKIDVLLEAKEALEKVDLSELDEEDADLDDEDAIRKLFGVDDAVDDINRDSSRNNLAWVLINEENSVSYGWGENERWLRTRLFGYAYGLDDMEEDDVRIIRSNDEYSIQQVSDPFTGMDYVECWGELDNGSYFLVRTPNASIHESVAISNRFYFFVGLAAVVICGMLVWFMMNRVTRPISELTTLSQKMAGLDFEQRYESHAGNEIDLLGESFNRMSDQLESTISELKSANLELQKDIENKIRAEERRKEFLDNVSHELKTPIALIQGYAEGLKENISEDPESREFYCDVIMDEASRMNKLVRNLLTLNQLEAGQDAVVMERFDITALISGVLQSMDILIQQKEAKVVFDQKEPVYVWGDEFKVEEVVTNYVSNALNHLEGDSQIEIRVRKEERTARISVFNTGTPIPEEDLPNLWQKFYKVDKARTREYGGSGIGLSIVKAVMESMNQQYGVINYENGVEFWFTLDLR
ncbi:MAG: HAMP domain-containing protein [Blautia sp.]|nr:HAMP domain-containing protein [Blautia sp.]